MRAPTFGSKGVFASLINSLVASGQVAIQLVTGARLKLGGGTNDYMSSDGTNIAFGCAVSATGWAIPALWDLVSDGAGSIMYRGYKANSGTTRSHRFSSGVALSTAGAAIASFENNANEKAILDKDGQLENMVAGMGVILKSPDGTRYRITVANGGTVAVALAP